MDRGGGRRGESEVGTCEISVNTFRYFLKAGFLLRHGKKSEAT